MKINEKLLAKKPTKNGERKKISIDIESSLSNWLNENNLSPTAIFKEACKELGFGSVETYDVPKDQQEEN